MPKAAPKPVEKKQRKHRIDDSDVLRRSITGLAKMGKTMDEMADILGVSKSYLEKHYKTEIKCGREIANALVVENLYQQAMKDGSSAVQAGIYITKARMGWRDKDEERNRAPAVVFDFSGLDYDERLRLMSKISGQPIEEDEDEGQVIDGTLADEE